MLRILTNIGILITSFYIADEFDVDLAGIFVNFQTRSSSTYLVSTITLSGILRILTNIGILITSFNIADEFDVDLAGIFVNFQTRSSSTYIVSMITL